MRVGESTELARWGEQRVDSGGDMAGSGGGGKRKRDPLA